MTALRLIVIFLLASVAFGVSPSLVNFNTGQVSPLMEARTDFQKYNSSCRTVENMFVTVHGSATRRPGTRFVAGTKSNNLAVLIPFEISTNDSYVLEFTATAMRVYRDDGT